MISYSSRSHAILALTGTWKQRGNCTYREPRLVKEWSIQQMWNDENYTAHIVTHSHLLYLMRFCMFFNHQQSWQTQTKAADTCVDQNRNPELARLQKCQWRPGGSTGGFGKRQCRHRHHRPGLQVGRFRWKCEYQKHRPLFIHHE